MMGGMMGNGMGNPFGLFGFGSVFMILFYVLLILGIVYLVKYIIKENSSKEEKIKREDPFEVLKLRLAKGEITKKEFETLKKELKGT